MCECVLELGSVLEGVEGDDSVVVVGSEEHRRGVRLASVDVVQGRVPEERYASVRGQTRRGRGEWDALDEVVKVVGLVRVAVI